MFIPRDPTTLSHIELLKESQAIETYIQDLTWLETKLQDRDALISVIEPYYTDKEYPGSFGAVLEITQGSCLRVLLKISRRQMTMRDQLEHVRFFLKGKKDEISFKDSYPNGEPSGEVNHLHGPYVDEYGNMHD